MNAHADSTISLPDSLLNLAQWLDSQDLLYKSEDARNAGVNLCYPFVNSEAWEDHLNSSPDAREYEPRYYSHQTTNKERVLAVLMLREMILNGDA